MPEKVAVIGGGLAGLVATKVFTEDGFDVTSYETRPYVGGLWKDNHDSTISVQPTTIFNSSKFRVALSDFPFPESTDTYPTAAQIYDYLGSYADHFDLRRHYHLNTKVKHILRQGDRWALQVTDQTTNTTRTDYFDRVCTATGTYFSPRFPKLQGIEKFGGRVLHSIDFHNAEQFRDQNVLLIGMHATTQDVTSELSAYAKHVYMAHRSGVLLLPRFSEDGGAFDATGKLPVTLMQLFLENWAPAVWLWILNTLCRGFSTRAYGDLPARLGLSPAPNMAIATPLMADTIYPFLESGFAEPVSQVKEIAGPRTVELANGRILEDIDAIIYCTGYHMTLPADLIPKTAPSPSVSDPDPSSYNPYPNGPGTNPHLYMNTFPMTSSPSINNTLAFVGHAAINFPGFIQQELQVCSISQIWQGRKRLPLQDEMLAWHRKHTLARNNLGRKYGAVENGTFYPILLPFNVYFPWLNHTAGTGVLETFGGIFNGLFNPCAWRLWWTDREMYRLCTRGIFTPTVFRIFDAGGRRPLDWEDARARLRRDNEVFERARKAKKAELDREKMERTEDGKEKRL